MKLGLFGGSFDPLHNDHLNIARAFADELNLTQMLFLPAGNPYHKDSKPMAAHHRLAMLELATQADERFGVSDCDLVRKGATYTADTIQIFRQLFPDVQLWWLLGADSLLKLHTWKNWTYIVQNCHIAVALREGAQLAHLPTQLQTWYESAMADGSLRLLPLAPLGVSSTQVRLRLKQGESCRDLIPEAVADYIQKHQLYL